MSLFCPFLLAVADVIRVLHVTVVQPSALPILPPCASVAPAPLIVPPDQLSSPVTVRFPPPASVPPPNVKGALIRDRSEERRVGKECRARGAWEDVKQKAWKERGRRAAVIGARA